MLKSLYEKQSPEWKQTFKNVVYFSLFFHILAAWFSEGFHRPDEHLGIMRFVGWKLGMLTDAQAHVSWEWGARIRPWLQPAIYVALLSPFKMMGFDNPFALATIMRFFNALIGELSLIILFLLSPCFIAKEEVKKITLWAIALLWYVPFFHARGTSEHFSTSFFIFALPFFFGKTNFRNSLLSGLFFGASFIFRYQMCVPIFFLCLWQLFQTNKRLSFIATLTLSFFAFNGLSAFVDFWGYGEWTFPPYQYLYWNIFEGKASSFGVDPWWKYFEKVITRGIPPISLALIIPTLWFWSKKRGHYLTWITLSFFIVHSMIGHKEIRFLFGIGLFTPLFFGAFLESYSKLLKWKRSGYFLIALSLLLMMISSTKVAYTPISFYKDLYNTGQEPQVIYTSDIVRDPMWFYMRKPFSFQILAEEDFLTKSKEVNGYFFSNNHKLQEALANSCKVTHQSYPQWALDMKPSFIKMKFWGLYFCQ